LYLKRTLGEPGWPLGQNYTGSAYY